MLGGGSSRHAASRADRGVLTFGSKDFGRAAAGHQFGSLVKRIQEAMGERGGDSKRRILKPLTLRFGRPKDLQRLEPVPFLAWLHFKREDMASERREGLTGRFGRSP